MLTDLKRNHDIRYYKRSHVDMQLFLYFYINFMDKTFKYYIIQGLSRFETRRLRKGNTNVQQSGKPKQPPGTIPATKPDTDQR